MKKKAVSHTEDVTMRKAVHLGMLFLAYGTPPRAQEAVPIRIDDRVRFRTTQGIDHEGWVRGLTAGAIEAASELSLLPNLPAVRGPHPQGQGGGAPTQQLAPQLEASQ